METPLLNRRKEAQNPFVAKENVESYVYLG
jgi:hypothetical protein